MSQDPITFVDIANRVYKLYHQSTRRRNSFNLYNLLIWVVRSYYFFSLYDCSSQIENRKFESQHFGALGEGEALPIYILWIK